MDFYSNEAQTRFRRFETLIEISHATEPVAYTPNSFLDITIRYMQYGGEPLLVFGIVDTLPPDWIYQGIVANEGAAPAISPDEGAQGELEFAWIEPPAMPGSFTYRVFVPETTSGQAHLSGYGLYRFTGTEQQTALSEIYIPQAWP